MSGPRTADTIFALSSGAPPAGVALLRISGPDAASTLSALCGELPLPRQASLRTLSDPDTGEWLDQALVLRFVAPASATGEDVVEIHAHGGRAVVARLLDTLGKQPGLRLAEPGEFTRRALSNGRIDLVAAEGLADLLAAETEWQRKAAAGLVGGLLTRQVEALAQTAVELSARAEVAIDYVDEVDGDAIVSGLAEDIGKLRDDVDALLAHPRIEPMQRGYRVAIAGPPNAGKSSLLNALVGDERAIVTDIEGTTRDSIEVPLSIDGLPLLFVDTAGIRETGDLVEQMGIARSETEIQRADLVLWLGNPSSLPSHPKIWAIHAKADLDENPSRDDPYRVSIAWPETVRRLRSEITRQAATSLRSEDGLYLHDRHVRELAVASELLSSALIAPVEIVADCLRQVREAFDRLTGRADIDAMLDSLFGRFCLGK